MTDTQWNRLEADLRKVPGVRSARIIGDNGSPSEIHIVSTSSRAPKQVVRDVQSLATAGFGIQIDHRIVSIVQLDEPLEPDPPRSPKRTQHPRTDAGSARCWSAWCLRAVASPDG